MLQSPFLSGFEWSCGPSTCTYSVHSAEHKFELGAKTMFKSSILQIQDRGTAEERLWRAVITKTLEEWICGPLSFSRKAEQFLFDDNKDFKAVCSSAGMDPESLEKTAQNHTRSRHPKRKYSLPSADSKKVRPSAACRLGPKSVRGLTSLFGGQSLLQFVPAIHPAMPSKQHEGEPRR